MKAVVLRQRHAGIEALEFREVPKPTPTANEVRVRVHAASINDWDFGLMQPEASRLDRIVTRLSTPDVSILGCDVAGRVEAVGPGVATLRPGDDVHGDLSGCGFGAFAEYVCAPATALVRKPAGMTFEQAAALPQAGMLAVQGLIDLGGIGKGQHVLLNGAGGGVGTFAVQLARLHDAQVTAVDKAGKLGMLRQLGAHEVIDYARCDFTETGVRYDLILDMRTTRSPFAHARALRPGGRYVTVGGDLPRLLQAALASPWISLLQGKRMRVVALKPNKDLPYVNGLFETGRLHPIMEGPYALDDLPAAFRRFATGEHHGKIIVKVT